MSPYRKALLALAGLVVVAVGFTYVARSSPPAASGMSGSAALIPADSRQPAAAFTGIDGWLNSSPLTLGQLHGRVVLVDFWTFSCINCVRTLPHLAHLEQTLGPHGLVIVGVHSPEFDFEKQPANVAAAVKRLRVTWPVAIDSEMSTWNAYGNQYWPAEYLIDQNGRVAYIHAGEGDESTTESAIAALLKVATPSITAAPAAPNPSGQTPELYAGSERGSLADGESYGASGQPTSYGDDSPPRDSDAIKVSGTWADHGQYLESTSAGHIRLRFAASNLFLVVGSASGTSLSLAVTVDGQRVPSSQSGADLVTSTLTVNGQRLYDVLVGQSRGAGHHLVDVSVPAGLRLYTFTFG